MTKSTPVRTSQRSSSRISAQATQKTNGSVMKKSGAAIARKQSLVKKIKKSVSTEVQKGFVLNIRDFKKQSGKTMYLVQRDGTCEDVWETEDMIEDLDVLTNYVQKVYKESGYAINDRVADGSGNFDHQQHQDINNQEDGETSRKRPSRASKARAVIALKRPEFVEEEEDDRRENNNGRTNNKSIKTNSGTKKRAANKGTASGPGRKTKAQTLLEQQQEEILERKKSRDNLNPDEIVCQLNHDLCGKNCCLQCGVNTYREALERDDLGELKKALEGRNLPHFVFEDKPNGLGLIEYAVVLQRGSFADLIAEDNKKPEDRRPLPVIPAKYRTYAGGNTGRNHYMGGYHRASFRKVEEARGNRVGNSAFYREDTNTPRKAYLNVEDPIKYSGIRSFLPFISKPAFQDERVIDNYLVHFANGPAEAYYAISSGSRKLSMAIIQHVNAGGRSTFNHLHEEVLKFDKGQRLTTYRKPQILKMASDAFNVTPYHCAAINPTATYLSELYEALDPAERLDTDAFGRSVLFYAAVSETTACLEYLFSKGFNATIVDKYKMSPLVQAARFGRSHNIELLIKNLRGGEEFTEIPPSIFQTLMRNRRTALHYAAFFGHAEACRMLIKYGAPVDCVEQLDKQTPLLYAAKNGYVDCVRILIEEGKANPEKSDKFSRTALHYACINGHIEVVKYLLSQGVNANAVDSSNNCPVHFATAFGYIKILHLLIEYGSADPSTCNIWRSTPCSIANMKGHIGIVKYLLSLPDSSINVNFKDQEGCTMLQHCIDESVATAEEKVTNIEKADLLLSMNADVNSINLEGNTSLHTLASNPTYTHCLPKGWEQFYPFKTSYEKLNSKPYAEDDMDGAEYQAAIAKLLIKYGANLDIKNNYNETPLITAMKTGNYFLAATLLEASAKFWEGVDKDGNNFFHFYGTLMAFVNSLRPHYDLEVLRKERFLKAAEKIWDAIDMNSSASNMVEIQKTIHALNNDGRTPFFSSVFRAIDEEKMAMKLEKDMILATFDTPSSSGHNTNMFGSNNYSYGSNNNNKAGGYPSKKFEEHIGLVDVNLQLNFDIWINFMSRLAAKFKINLNESADLPRDYKKNNPLSKKSDYPVFTGSTALHLAAQTQCVELIKFLMELGCNPNVRVKHGDIILSGDTPLMIAYHHKNDKFEEVPFQSPTTAEQVTKKFNVIKPDFKKMLNHTVKIMLKFKACPFLTNAAGNSVLMGAARSMDVENLAEMCAVEPSEDANVNTEDENGNTALMIALDSIATITTDIGKKQGVTMVKSLLLANADPNVQYEDGDTILIKVINTSFSPLLEVVLKSSIVSIDHKRQNKRLETAMIIACKLNKIDVVLPYLNYLKESNSVYEVDVYDVDKATALTFAARNGNLQVVSELLLLGAQANFRSPEHVPLIEAVSSHNFDIVELLLKHGANVNEQELNGNTAIHKAILTEKHRIVQFLLQNGANPNLKNARKQSPLHLAVKTTKKQTNRSFRVERLLIQAGADLNATDYFGRTPLHYVFVESDLIPITRNTAIISKKVAQISNELKIEEDRAKVLKSYARKFDIIEPTNSSHKEFDYLGEWMKEAKEIQMDQEEKERKENQEKDEDDGLVILEEEKEMLKVYYTYGWETKTLIPARFDPIDILKYLSEFDGLHYDTKDDFGRTPLHYAACVGAFSCTTLLIDKKVDINAVDFDHNGALQLALRNNYVDYSVMLCNFGAAVNNDIVLKDGHSTTTFGFSLSQNLINMAYLIMDRGVTLIESIRDALKNGKFHMVEILLQSAKDESLSGTLQSKNQNIWHIIADFKPFSTEIWEEYVFDIINRISALNLPISKDNSGRTPIHYAAKHGQSALLQRFLAMPGAEINIIDSEGNIELTYAVDSGNIEVVKSLLNAGAKVTHDSGYKKESPVLKSVLANNIKMTELLLYNGASVDQDSSHGRINAVMVACQKKNIEMMKLLILYKADLNKPSHVERKDKFGKKFTVLLHPIFVASNLDFKLLKMMLEAGVNPNVHGPDSAPEYGQSCFMYNVSLDKIENQKILLDYNIDLNTIAELKSSRTIFYQFFFGKLGYGNESKEVHGSYSSKLNFNEAVHEKMIQEYKPEVNHIDKISGMTPLELAIREKNSIIVEKLLAIGADTNVESCKTVKDSKVVQILNTSGKKLPALLHAILQNRIDLVRLICEKSRHEINWMWHNDEKHNVMSYITGSMGGISHENIAILEYLASQMDSKTLKKLLQMRDIYGKSPVYNAYQRVDKNLYETMIRLEPSCALTESDHMEIAEGSAVLESLPMDIDYITTANVDKDAMAERKILQEKKDIEKAKKRETEGRKDNDDEETVKVDSYSKLQKVGSVMLDENNQPYDIMLFKVELYGWGIYTETNFYKMSIIHNKVLDLYILWTRWGAYGQEGQHQKTPYLNIEEAIAEFKSIFRAKTSNLWENRSTANFVHKLGRYDILRIAHHPTDKIIDNFDFMDSTAPTQLPRDIADLMKLICNYTYLSRIYSESHIDMPLGQVPQKAIEQAQQILKDVVYMTEMSKEAKSHYSDRAKLQEAKTWDFKIAEKCVEYARLLPRAEDRNQPIRSLSDDRGTNIKRELARIADLSYVGFAANVILAAKHHVNDINPLEYAYNALNCSLRSISMKTKPSEYQLIKSYMESTSTGNQELVHLFSVYRTEEEVRFRPFEKEANRKLLWHGSRVGNFMGILKQGLRVCPRTSATNGAMLGNGVYFADTFAKSLGYATDYYGSQQSTYKLMMLCEVALGSKTAVYQPKAFNQHNYTKDLDSMKGEGSNIPDPANAVYDPNGVCIPMGPCIPFALAANTNTTSNLVGFNAVNNGPVLNYNEFAVYDENRVKIRYLLIVRESKSCFLCSKSSDKLSALKPHSEHNVKKYNCAAFNEFEREVIKAYLTHENKTPQDILDEGLNEFIDSGKYKHKWDVPLDLRKDSKVCLDCAKDVVALLLHEKMTSPDIDIPESLKSRPQCKYGKECRTQKHNKIHAKKYQHWLKESISEEVKNTETVEAAADDEEDDSAMETDGEENSMDTDEE